MKHGYTNLTVGTEANVEKHYRGPDATARFDRERRLVTALQEHLPVPQVIGADPGILRLAFVHGTPGQELLDAGSARAALRSSGAVLRRIHELPTALLDSTPGGAGPVIVHGDFGPNNLLLDPTSMEVTAVVDWEFAHLGERMEDIAWCEWIVRMHHPEHIDALDDFFDAYGEPVPPWELRRAAMIERCEALMRFCQRWQADGPAVHQWKQRTATTASWSE